MNKDEPDKELDEIAQEKYGKNYSEINLQEQNIILSTLIRLKLGREKKDLLQIKEAYDFLESLNIHPKNLFWLILNRAIEQGIDRVNWILNNKELIKEIAEHGTKTLSEPFRKKCWNTIMKEKK